MSARLDAFLEKSREWAEEQALDEFFGELERRLFTGEQLPDDLMQDFVEWTRADDGNLWFEIAESWREDGLLSPERVEWFLDVVKRIEDPRFPHGELATECQAALCTSAPAHLPDDEIESTIDALKRQAKPSGQLTLPLVGQGPMSHDETAMPTVPD